MNWYTTGSLVSSIRDEWKRLLRIMNTLNFSFLIQLFRRLPGCCDVSLGIYFDEITTDYRPPGMPVYVEKSKVYTCFMR